MCDIIKCHAYAGSVTDNELIMCDAFGAGEKVKTQHMRVALSLSCERS